jgi:hypothetical protein
MNGGAVFKRQVLTTPQKLFKYADRAVNSLRLGYKNQSVNAVQ